MRTPTRFTRFAVAAGTTIGAIAVVVGASAGVSSAHKPTIWADCSGVHVEAVSYEAKDTNVLGGNLDGTVEGPTAFAVNGSLFIPRPANLASFTWSGYVNTTNPGVGYSKADRGTVTGCKVPEHIPVTLCHQKGNGDYVTITIDDDGQNFHGHGKHKGDIIPAPKGGCPVPEVTTTTAAPEDTTTTVKPDDTTTTVKPDDTTTTAAPDETTTTAAPDETTTTAAPDTGIVCDPPAVKVTNEVGSYCQTVAVDVPPTPQAPTPTPVRPAAPAHVALPATGAKDQVPAIAMGTAFLLLGGAALLVKRKRPVAQ